MKTKVLRVILFFLIILIIPAFTLLGEKETVSYNENKTLAEFPKLSFESWKNRSFMTGLSDYFSDHFVLREEFIRFKNSIEKIIGKNEINEVFEINGNLIQTFKNIDYKLTDRNISAMNKLKSKNPDVAFYFVPIITAQEIYSELLPAYLNLESEADYIEYCKSKLIGVEITDVSREIHDTDYPFYKTDHHWTTDSAYNAYVKVSEKLGFTPLGTESFKIESVSDEFRGTLYSKTLNEKITSDTIKAYKTDTEFVFTVKEEKHESLYFEKFLNEKDKYSYFLSGNHGISSIENKSISEKKELLLIKDSYANCFVPFLAEHYSKITLVDPRYCSHTQIRGINPSEYNEVIILFNVSGFSQEQNFSLIELMGGSND
ncbi:MAG: hypothetical protein IJE48_08685 [Clostridia bacterium]|nr:hypothetical protein [Clostridia bacterium]